jgi:cbb3-type cytochrome oxidase maturation protein
MAGALFLIPASWVESPTMPAFAKTGGRLDSLYLLIPLAAVLVGIAVRLLFWAVKSGQYDDLETESRRILFDNSDKPPTPPESVVEEQNQNGKSR